MSMLVLYDDIDKVIEERKTIERVIIHKILSSKKVIIKKLPRNKTGRYLSFSPRMLDDYAEKKPFDNMNYAYNGYSRRIHSLGDDRRGTIEAEIATYIPQIDIPYVQYEIISKSYTEYYDYCVLNHIRVGNKRIYNRICNLIRKWREYSQDVHYKLTKQEKRKLKKIEKRSNEL